MPRAGQYSTFSERLKSRSCSQVFASSIPAISSFGIYVPGQRNAVTLQRRVCKPGHGVQRHTSWRQYIVVLRVQARWCWVLARPHDGVPWTLHATSQLVLVRLHHGIHSVEQGPVMEQTCSDVLRLLVVTVPVHPGCRLRRAVDDERRIRTSKMIWKRDKKRKKIDGSLPFLS